MTAIALTLLAGCVTADKESSTATSATAAPEIATSTSLGVEIDAEAQLIPVQRVTVIDARTVNVNVLLPSCEQLDATRIDRRDNGWTVSASAIPVAECTDADEVVSMDLNAALAENWDGKGFYDASNGLEIPQS